MYKEIKSTLDNMKNSKQNQIVIRLIIDLYHLVNGREVLKMVN